MTSSELERLARAGLLRTEPPASAEIAGLLASGAARLADARRENLSNESRFDLAYNAAHAFALAALRLAGYRTDRRYLVFQALPHTLGCPPAVWRLLSKCHELRNRIEYEGIFEVDTPLLAGLLDATETLCAAVTSRRHEE